MSERFRTLLVANRGEIASRVLRTARELGYRTVAVYSEPDADAPFVAEAHLAVPLGGALPSESYLDAGKILAAARRAGAQAIHPGYGFLSESAAFARACAEAGLVFVGPPATAIALMGDKAAAKRRMLDAKVPCVPGAISEDQRLEALGSAARRVGYPLMVKAVAGGGGRGMRLVRSAGELAGALESARAEAQNAFGCGDLMLERLIEGARHVEVQVFADEHGHAIHLGERECSVQRRHQKIVEESPSPAVDPELRERLGAAAIAAAKAIGYVGAGTLEFLLAPSGEFFFMEMNTRLQVEHAVTELVTGLDLVEWQLRVAQGEELPLRQEEISFRGHAIEARLYAEDPEAGFLPQSGRVLRLELPEHVRVDCGVREGSAISPYYDPMIAKLIAHGPSREAARRKLVSALEDTVLLGVATNRRFLVELLSSEEFERAQIVTDTLDARGTPECAHHPDWLWTLGALVACLPEGELDAWRSTSATELRLSLRSGDSSTRALRVGWRGDELCVRDSPSVRLLSRGRGRLRCAIDGVAFTASFARDGAVVHVQARGQSARFEEVQPRARALEQVRDKELTSPMAGRVLAVSVAAGERVERGQCVAVVESMKMQHRVAAPFAGRVLEVRVAAGDQVAARRVLAALEPEGG